MAVRRLPHREHLPVLQSHLIPNNALRYLNRNHTGIWDVDDLFNCFHRSGFWCCDAAYTDDGSTKVQRFIDGIIDCWCGRFCECFGEGTSMPLAI